MSAASSDADELPARAMLSVTGAPPVNLVGAPVPQPAADRPTCPRCSGPLSAMGACLTDAAHTPPAARPTLADLYRRAANTVEGYAFERRQMVDVLLGRGDPRPMLGLVEARRREAHVSLSELWARCDEHVAVVVATYCGGILTCDTSVEADEEMGQALRALAQATPDVARETAPGVAT